MLGAAPARPIRCLAYEANTGRGCVWSVSWQPTAPHLLAGGMAQGRMSLWLYTPGAGTRDPYHSPSTESQQPPVDLPPPGVPFVVPETPEPLAGTRAAAGRPAVRSGVGPELPGQDLRAWLSLRQRPLALSWQGFRAQGPGRQVLGQGGRLDVNQVLFLPHGLRRSVRAVAWHPLGHALAAGTFAGRVQAWTWAAGGPQPGSPGAPDVPVHRMEIEPHVSEIKAIAWSPSGEELVTCGRDRLVTRWLIEFPTGETPVGPAASEAPAGAGEPETSYTGFQEVALDSMFQEDGCYACLNVLEGHTQDVKSVRFAPGRRDVLASCSYDGTVRVWREHSSEPAEALANGFWATDSVLQLPPPTSAGDATVLAPTVWAVAWLRPGSLEESQGHQGLVLLVSADGAGRVGVWEVLRAGQDPLCRQVLTPHSGASGAHPIVALAVHPRAPHVVAATSQRGWLYVLAWGPTEPGSPASLRCMGAAPVTRGAPAFGLAWHPTNPALLCVGGADGSLGVWHVGSAVPDERG